MLQALNIGDRNPDEVYVGGLDLSLSGTGFVVRSLSGLTKHRETIGFSLERGVPVRIRTERLIVMRNRLHASVAKWSLDAIGIENYAFGARGAQSDLAELHGVVRVMLWERLRLDTEYVVVQSARLNAFGKGKMTKPEVVAAVQKKTGTKMNEDEADAWAIAEYIRLAALGGLGAKTGKGRGKKK